MMRRNQLQEKMMWSIKKNGKMYEVWVSELPDCKESLIAICKKHDAAVKVIADAAKARREKYANVC